MMDDGAGDPRAIIESLKNEASRRSGETPDRMMALASQIIINKCHDFMALLFIPYGEEY